MNNASFHFFIEETLSDVVYRFQCANFSYLIWIVKKLIRHQSKMKQPNRRHVNEISKRLFHLHGILINFIVVFVPEDLKEWVSTVCNNPGVYNAAIYWLFCRLNSNNSFAVWYISKKVWDAKNHLKNLIIKKGAETMSRNLGNMNIEYRWRSPIAC